MIVVPERVAFIKVPKAASSTIAKRFWSTYGLDQRAVVSPETATALRYMVPLEQLATKVPVINGNWFFHRSGAFGWHTAYSDLVHVFGDQLNSYQWVASVRHPVARLFSVFSYQVSKGRLNAQLTAHDFERFCERVFAADRTLTMQQQLHTWSQVTWLPPADQMHRLTIIRQERMTVDMARLSRRIPSFRGGGFTRVNRSFSGECGQYVHVGLARRIESFYAEDMERLGYPTWVGAERRVA